MKKYKNVCDAIAGNGLCAGCGACAGLCASHAIKIEWNRYGEYNPVEIPGACNGCGLCLKVCPFWNQGENETTIAEREFGACKGAAHDPVTGLYIDLFSGYSTADSHRQNGASGGLTTWFLEKILERGIAKKICCVVPNSDPEKLFEYALVDSTKELRASSRSAYYPVELSGVISRILSSDDKCAVVGLPCALKALRLAMLYNAQLRDRVALLVGLVCGQQKSKYFAEYLCSIKGGDPSRLLSATFRVKDPGRHQLDHRFEFVYGAKDRAVKGHIYQTEGMSRVWGRDYFKINACNFCDDITSEVADISFGDAIAQPYSYGSGGANFVIVRSGEAKNLLLRGVESGEIVLNKAPLNALIERQQGVVLLKRDDLQHRLSIRQLGGSSYVPEKRFPPKSRVDALRNRDMQKRDLINSVSRESYAACRHIPGAALEVERAIECALAKGGNRSGYSKKVGILTFHNGINYGAFFQVYALQKFLKERGLESAVINYKDPGFTFREYMVFLSPLLSVKQIAANIVKIIKFKRAQRRLNLTGRVFNKAGLRRYYFDNVVIGSDEVWNFKSKFIGFNPVYFSKFLQAGRIISYAASFGAVKEGEKVPEELGALLGKLDAISVRDTNSFNIMRSISAKPAQVVLDPVFLVDLRKEAILPEAGHFILVYGFFSEKMIAKISEYARSRNKKTISVGYGHSWCDVSLGSLGPFEWLGYFAKCDAVITTMYHGMIFSLLNSKEFCLFSTEYRKNKIGNILNDLKLSDRMIDEEGSLSGAFARKIDYTEIHSNIDALRNKSIDYLSAALAD